MCVVKGVTNYPFTMIGSKYIESTRPADVMDVFTHEIGHQFFLHNKHRFDPLDDGKYPCPTKKLFDSKCTMGGNDYPKSFCYDFVAQIRQRGFNCLDKKPSQGEVPKCGNGVLDYGEECDCGSSQDCLERNPCCDGQICKLKRGAQCTDDQTCCKNCKMNMEKCPVDSAGPSKRAWVPFSYTSTYKEITSPTSGTFVAIPFGRLTPQNKVFSWLLRAPAGQRVRVELTVPQMKSEYFDVWIGCPYDWVEVRDGGEVTSPLLGRYCTPLRNPVLWSSSNELLVRLRSDSSFDSHFVIEYEFTTEEDEKDDHSEEEGTCLTGDGASYRGTLAVTSSGKSCQAWSAQTPHSHSTTPGKYPNSGLDKNYCRNPKGEHSTLWCYTTNPDMKWDNCYLPKCGPEETCRKGHGESYRGTLAITSSGRLCQAWGAQKPHSHRYTVSNYPNSGLDKNFCRNPKGEHHTVWCYTTDPDMKYESCALPECGTVLEDLGPEVQDVIKDAGECYNGNGESYRGTAALTWSRQACQAWSPPTGNRFYNPVAYPKSDLTKNYCRNPDPETAAPWCYLESSSDSRKWAFCAIPKCLKNKGG
ncbi:apolipoprotein(a)-like [Branchiostoma floridae]|uniref:Apolipoprotein(A)-like n=1 Tax=Branchiostoma floridae TaxID=7739 RepID=A0A9J7N8G5_BRAFL|nr:apolipoprotein(a)-like [Branchiostoma floridae]